MKTLGVDPSSSRSGLVIVEDDRILHKEQWTTRSETLPINLMLFQARVRMLVITHDVRLVRIEEVKNVMNLNTVRKIAYFEAAAMAGASVICPVEMIGISTARKRVLGNGGLNKQAAAEMVRSALEDPSFTLDECDALVVALADEGREPWTTKQ